MFWRSKKSTKKSKPRRASALAHWKLEHLESRQMLSVVNVVITAGPLGNSMAMMGDSQGDSVELQSDPTTPGQYIITGNAAGGNPTLLSLNGGTTTNQPLTVNNITGDISVSLGSGNTTFDFEGPGGTALSTTPANLVITNSTGSDSVILNNVLVNGNLTVTKTAGASGNASLSVTNTTVIGNTTIDNTGAGTGGGSSITTINSSALEGQFLLKNANGFASLTVTSTTSPTTFGAANKGVDNVSILNGDGGSTTTFAASTTMYGALNITNGNTLPGELELVSFTGTTVQGGTTIVNGNSATKVVSTNSNLGMQYAGPLVPAPVTITNGVGFDALTVSGSTVPWGMSVSNDAAGTGNWGSSTSITSSSIGTRIGGPNIPLAPVGDALQIIGDKGPDVVSLATNTIGGTLDLSQLGSGSNSVTLDSNTIGSVNIATSGAGNNFVKIAGGVIQAALNINFGNVGSNELDLRNGSTQINGSTVPVLPSTLSGTITIFGGTGVNTFRYDVGIAIPPLSGFSIFSSP